MIKDIRIPEISENVTSGNVVAVLVAAGDDLDVDDPVIEFETEKAVVEIPSPYKGQITEVLVEEGDELNVGDAVARIETEKEAAGEEEEKEEDRGAEQKGGAAKPEPESASEEEAAPSNKEAEPPQEEEPKEKEEDREDRGGPGKTPKAPEKEEEDRGGAPESHAEEGEEEPARREGKEETAADDAVRKRGPAPASPSVRRFARELGVDIHSVAAEGPGDRITEDDIKAHVKKRLAAKPNGDAAAAGPGPAEKPPLPDFSRWGEVDFRELSGVRRLTAKSMAVSWQTVAHVTQFERADITAVTAFIDRHADKVAEKDAKLTLTAVLMKICAGALKRFPQFNASIDTDNNRLIFKKYVHIGLAVDTPRGLLVPVVRDADQKTIQDLAVDIVDLARRARNKKIKPDEMEGGTFTISNQGGIGGTDFTPLVFWPQAAILGVSRATTAPRFLDGEFRPREMLPLALSYDHRIADGADAARFMRWIRESLEQPLTLHLD